MLASPASKDACAALTAFGMVRAAPAAGRQLSTQAPSDESLTVGLNLRAVADQNCRTTLFVDAAMGKAVIGKNRGKDGGDEDRAGRVVMQRRRWRRRPARSTSSRGHERSKQFSGWERNEMIFEVKHEASYHAFGDVLTLLQRIFARD